MQVLFGHSSISYLNIVYIPEGFAGIISGPAETINVELCLGTSGIMTCVGFIIWANVGGMVRGLVAHLDSGHTPYIPQYILLIFVKAYN